MDVHEIKSEEKETVIAVLHLDFWEDIPLPVNRYLPGQDCFS
jgi:hypothetical protein